MADVVGEAFIEIHADDKGLPGEVTRATNRAVRRAKITIPIDADTDGFFRDLNGRLRNARGQFAAEGKNAGTSFGGGFKQQVDSLFSRSGQFTFISKLATAVTGLLGSIAPIGPIFGGAAAATVALAAALVQASGAAIAAGGVLASLGLAGAALAVGFQGVGDAVKAQSDALKELATTGEITAATQKKVDESLKGLAPSAREAVAAIGALRTQFAGVQQVVQQNLFAGIGASIQRVGSTFLPILQRQLAATATLLSQTANSFAAFITSGQRSGQINAILGGLLPILSNILTVIQPLTAGFLDIFQASLPFALQLSEAIARVGANFGAFLSGAAQSGAFAEFMQAAFEAASSLAGILGNLGSVLASVFSAGSASGAGILNVLESLTAQLAAFFRSAEGQTALADFFGLIGQAGQSLSQIFGVLGPIIGGIGAVFAALSPVLASFRAALLPIITALGQSLGAALRQLAPLLAQLLLAVQPLAAALGSTLLTVFQALAPVILQLVSSLTPLIGLLAQGLAQALTTIAPLFTQLSPVIVQIVAALGTGLVPVFQTLIPVITQIIALLAPLVAQLISQLLPAILPLIPAALQLVAALLQLVPALLPLIELSTRASSVIINGLSKALTIVVPFIVNMTAALTGLVTKLVQVIAAVVRFVANFVSNFSRLRAQVTSAITGMVSSVVSAIGRFVSGVLSSIESLRSRGVAAAKNFASGVASAITSGLSGLADRVAQFGRNVIDGFVGGLSSGLDRVRNIAGQIASAVTGPVGKFLNIGSPSKVMEAMGKDTTQGFINGLREKIPQVRAAATLLARATEDQVASSIGRFRSSINSIAGVLSSAQRTTVNQLFATASVGVAALDRAQAAVDSRLKTAAERLKTLTDQARQFTSQVAQNILQTGNIAQSQNTSFQGLVATLRNAVVSSNQFADTIARLSRAGLNRTSLQQIVEAGPAAGNAIGESILQAGRSGIAQINALQTNLANAANRAARTAGDALFGQGLRVAQGVLAGLRSQRAALDAQMVRLGDILVARVLRLLRNSKVGNLSVPGFAKGGIVSSPSIIAAGERTPELVVPISPNAALNPGVAQALAQVAAARGLGGGTIEVQIPISAGAVVDLETLSNLIAVKIAEQTGRRVGITVGDGVKV